MEFKDWIYTAGLILTFGISLISLLVNIKNRRNAIREHLYKEQFNFFLKLSKELHLLLDLFYEVNRQGKLSDENDKKIEKCNQEIYDLSEIHDFLTPDEMISFISDTIKKGDDLYTKSIKQNITKEEILVYQNSYFDLTEKIREMMGVDKLSDENKKLYR